MRYPASRLASCRKTWCRGYLSTPWPNVKPIVTGFFGPTAVVRQKIPMPSGRCWAIWIYIGSVREIIGRWAAFLVRNWPLTKVLRAYVFQYGRLTRGGCQWSGVLTPGMAVGIRCACVILLACGKFLFHGSKLAKFINLKSLIATALLH